MWRRILCLSAAARAFFAPPFPPRCVVPWQRSSVRAHAQLDAFEVLRGCQVTDPRDGSEAALLAGLEGRKSLVVLAPQLGDFDSAEYAEQLAAKIRRA